MRWLLLLFFFPLGCQSDSPGDDTDSGVGQRLSWQDEMDTLESRYHIVFAGDPMPAQVGSFSLNMAISINSPNPCFSGAALLNANVSIDASRPENGDSWDGSVGAEELGGGIYSATLSFAQPGYWELEIRVGAAEDTDIALIGLIVED